MSAPVPMTVTELREKINPIIAKLERIQRTALADVAPATKQDKEIVEAILEKLCEKRQPVARGCSEIEQEIRRLTNHAQALMRQLRAAKAAAESTAVEDYGLLPMICVFLHLEFVLNRQEALRNRLLKERTRYRRLEERIFFADLLGIKIRRVTTGRELIEYLVGALNWVKDASPNDISPAWIDLDKPVATCGKIIGSPDLEPEEVEFKPYTRELLMEFWDCAEFFPSQFWQADVDRHEERARLWRVLINEMARRPENRKKGTFVETFLRRRKAPEDKQVELLEAAEYKRMMRDQGFAASTTTNLEAIQQNI